MMAMFRLNPKSMFDHYVLCILLVAVNQWVDNVCTFLMGREDVATSSFCAKPVEVNIGIHIESFILVHDGKQAHWWCIHMDPYLQSVCDQEFNNRASKLKLQGLMFWLLNRGTLQPEMLTRVSSFQRILLCGLTLHHAWENYLDMDYHKCMIICVASAGGWIDDMDHVWSTSGHDDALCREIRKQGVRDKSCLLGIVPTTILNKLDNL